MFEVDKTDCIIVASDSQNSLSHVSNAYTLRLRATVRKLLKMLIAECSSKPSKTFRSYPNNV